MKEIDEELDEIDEDFRKSYFGTYLEPDCANDSYIGGRIIFVPYHNGLYSMSLKEEGIIYDFRIDELGRELGR